MFDSEYKIGMDAARNRHFKTAEYFLRVSAENGNIDAQNDLGVVFEKENDYKKAMFWYETAGKNGSGIGYANLGHLYMKINDFKKALVNIKKGVKMKNQYAYYLLGVMYREGHIVEKDDVKAYETWFKGIKYGNKYECDCLFQVGYCNEYGIGTHQDVERAEMLYKQSKERRNEIGSLLLFSNTSMQRGNGKIWINSLQKSQTWFENDSIKMNCFCRENVKTV